MGNYEAGQRAWARERGLEALTLPQILEAQIEEFRPDVIYASDPVTYDSRFFRRLAWQPKMLMGWRAAPTPEETDWSSFDLIISNHAPSMDMAVMLGAHATDRFEPGLPYSIASQVESEPEGCDVLFTGQWSDYHTRRNNYWLTIAHACEAATPPWSLEFHLLARNPESLPDVIARHRLPPRFGMDMHRLFKRGRICLNAMIDVGQDMSANMRLFEIAGTGGFQLMEHHEDIHRYFEPGREIATYRSPEELIEKVKYYLENPDERHEIARRGRERCEREFSMEKRIPWFEEILSNHLETASKRMKEADAGAGEGLRLRMKLIRAENRLAKTERRLEDRETELARVKKSFTWKLARPLFKIESKFSKKPL